MSAITSVAQRQQLQNFYEGVVAKQSHNLSQQNQSRFDRELSVEEMNNINYQVGLINIELSTFEFILYQKIQELMLQVKKLMEDCGEYRQKSKMLYNSAMTEANSLCIACRASENVDFMDTITCAYDRYRADYMKDGGMFFDTICYQWSKRIEQDMLIFHHSIRMAFINTKGINAKWTDLATHLYKIYAFCIMVDEVVRHEEEQIKLKVGVGVPIKQSPDLRFGKLKGIIKRLVDKYAPDRTLIPKSLGDQVQMAGQILLNKLTDDKSANTIVESLLDTIRDYAYYCVSRMIMDVRKNGTLCEGDKVMLKSNMDMSDDMIERMTTELKRTRIDISSGDPHEIKFLVPMMQKAHVVKSVFLYKLSKNVDNEVHKYHES